MNLKEMTHDQLVTFIKERQLIWKEEKEWYVRRLEDIRSRNSAKTYDRLMGQIRHLLLENNQLHKELEDMRELVELQQEVIKKLSTGLPTMSEITTSNRV